MTNESFCVSTSSDWTWHPTSWRRFLLTHCSCGSQCTLRWRDPPSRRWCWVLVGTLCTVTASWSGFAGWPERMTWRRVLHQKIWLGNTSGLSERYGPHPGRKNWSSSKMCSFSPTIRNVKIYPLQCEHSDVRFMLVYKPVTVMYRDPTHVRRLWQDGRGLLSACNTAMSN